MSTYDDDVLVPPGVRYLTRPGVAYIAPTPTTPAPAVPPRQPPVLSPSTPTASPRKEPAPKKHPIQPKAAPRTRQSPSKQTAGSVVIDPRAVYRPIAFGPLASTGPNTALADVAYRNTGQVARPVRSLSSLTPTGQSASMHPVQPVATASRVRPRPHALGTAVHRARKAADAIAEHLDEAHHFQHQYENRNKVEDFLKSQHALDRDAEQRMKLREEIAKPPLRGSEPTRPIWGDLGSIAGGRVEFDY